MKRKRKLFGILLIITALMIMQLPAAKADAAVSASDFKIEGSTLTGYVGTATNVSVPSTVTKIAEDAFENNGKIERVTLPSSVTEIAPFAFWGCENLETVILGSGLTTVGDYAFANCKGLTQMKLPSNIRSIGLQAFADCVNLKDITIGPQVTSIHETAFNGCYRLTIQAEEGSYADLYAEEFYKRQQEMPEYEDVDDYPAEEEDTEDSSQDTVSDDSTLGSLLGKTKVVGNQAVVFLDNTTLEVMSGAGKETLTQEQLPEGETGSNSEDGGEDRINLPKYTIVDGRIVADQAYYRNQNLQEVILPDTIEEIGQFSFARSSATKIALPERVQTVGYGAFYHCDRLAEVSLPDTVENVEPKAFVHTAWVENFLAGKEAVGSDGVVSGGGDFLISGGVLIAYRGSADSVHVPEGVRVIAAEAFAGHTEIQEMALPESLVTIGEGAFENCQNLSTVTLGKNLKQIKDRAFAGTGLVRLALPASLEEVGLKAFEEDVLLSYEGVLPASSYELSAQRLSNEAYRDSVQKEIAPGVEVAGSGNITAALEGAARKYLLTIDQNQDGTPLTKAYFRCFGKNIPEGTVIYGLKLTDGSEIPVTRLGRQLLKIYLPLTEEQAGRELLVYSVDRNGQLEYIESQRVQLDGQKVLSISLDYLSQIGIVETENTYSGEVLMEETTAFASMAAPQQEATVLPYKWILCGALLTAGALCILWRRRA